MLLLFPSRSDEALSRAEMAKAELELQLNRLRAEEASLRDALLKMQALNEGLGQDKIELNKIIMQVRPGVTVSPGSSGGWGGGVQRSGETGLGHKE